MDLFGAFLLEGAVGVAGWRRPIQYGRSLCSSFLAVFVTMLFPLFLRFSRILKDSRGFLRILWNSLGFSGILWDARSHSFSSSQTVPEGIRWIYWRFLEILRDSSGFLEILWDS